MRPVVAKADAGAHIRAKWVWAATLALGLAFVLAAGEAAAQGVCGGDVVTERTTIVVCNRGASETRDIHIDIRNSDIALVGYNLSPISVFPQGAGSITIDVTGGSLTTGGSWAKGIHLRSSGGSGDTAITLKDVDTVSLNPNGGGIYALREGGMGNIKIDVSGGSMTTAGANSGSITGYLRVSGNVEIDVKDVTFKDDGTSGTSVLGFHTGPTGDVDIAVQAGSIETSGFLGHGVYGGKISGRGNVAVSVAGASVTTRGRFARAISGAQTGEGDITIDVSGEAVIVAEGARGGVGVLPLHLDRKSVV